ncbi:MAG TPA: hypothetical protein VN238_10700 [Solirubrobacteraceae bacterium]|nr:hypothetical protein [Solirubrobacteraceae bacterium]
MSGETARGARDWVETLRRIAAVVVGVWTASWGTAIVHWLTGLEGIVLLPVAVAFAALGAAVGWQNARSLERWTSQERRDAIVGWSFVLALIGLVAVAAALGLGE